MLLRTDKRRFEKDSSPQKLVSSAPGVFFCLLSDPVKTGNGGFSSCYEGKTLFPWKLSLPIIDFHLFLEEEPELQFILHSGQSQSTYSEKPKSSETTSL